MSSFETGADSSPQKLQPAKALRQVFKAGYKSADFRADLLAGLVVGIVALPLSMALAIASGVAPQHGLYTAIIGGAIIAILGGSKVQVSGPTAAFVVILAPISAQYGLAGLLIATMFAGAILIALGLGGLGRLIEFIPYPVTTGFTSGIAVVIATLQLRDFLGLSVAKMPDEYLEKVATLWHAAPSFRWQDFSIGAATLCILIFWPKVTKRIPSPLVALAVAAIVAQVLAAVIPDFHVATINTRFSFEQNGEHCQGIPQLPPLPCLPWNFSGPDGQPLHFSMDVLRELAKAAVAIAMLGAIESLLSAVVADGMIGATHDPNVELVAQGIGNFVCPFFGGFAATGAIARTATNVRSGARSPIAAVIHALVVLAAVLAFAPLLGYLPMSALAALLLVVAWNMSELKHFVKLVRVAPRSDVLVLLTCFFLTVVFDMIVAVTVGFMLASLLFMQRMASISSVKLVGEKEQGVRSERFIIPDGVMFYEIAGPLFFGAARKALETVVETGQEAKIVVLDFRSVPMIDATGLASLEIMLQGLKARKTRVIIAGIQRSPRLEFAKAGLRSGDGLLVLARSFDKALRIAGIGREETEHRPSSREIVTQKPTNAA